MDWDRSWKWAERAGFVITVFCTAAGAYYAAGTYYGWDKLANAGGVATGGVPMNAPTSWLAIILLMVAVITLATSWAMILIRRRQTATRLTQVNPVPGTSSDIVLHHQYIDRIKTHFYIEPPSADRPEDSVQWGISIHLRKSIKNLMIRLDYSYHGGGMNGVWNPVRSLFVERLDTFIIGTNKKIPIAELDTSKAYHSWRWAFGDKGEIYLSTHRCCLTFLIGDDAVDRFDFVICAWKDRSDKDNRTTDLIFIGEDRFSFAKDWPAGPPA
jgi:hypothetical protein